MQPSGIRPSALWRCVREVAGNCSTHRCQQTVYDLIAVAARIKPAALIDQVVLDASRLRRLLGLLNAQLVQPSINLDALIVLDLGDEGGLFVLHPESALNLPKLFGNCQNMTTIASRTVVVNVTAGLPSPTFIAFNSLDDIPVGHWAFPICVILHSLSAFLAKVVARDQKQNDKAYTFKGSDSACFEWDVTRISRQGINSGLTIKCTFPRTVNLTSVYGLLLGYASIYWYDHIAFNANCLSMSSLRLYQAEFGIANEGILPRPTAYRFTSFTIPQCVADQLPEWDAITEEWTANLQINVSREVWGCNEATVRTSVVQLAQVGL
eukprot:CFRG7402T1